VKRDFALRVDSLLAGVRASLDSISELMRHHIPRGNISEEEFKKYVQFIGGSMSETVKLSRDLYRLFPDIEPEELKTEAK